jgi:uncharacterized protein YjiS (DUF1127 family)
MNSVQCIDTFRARRQPRNAQRRNSAAAIRHDAAAVLDLMSVWCRRIGLRRALRVYPDSMLAALGLTRVQAAAEAAKPFWVA